MKLQTNAIYTNVLNMLSLNDGISLPYRFTYHFHVRVHGFCCKGVATKHKIFILCKRNQTKSLQICFVKQMSRKSQSSIHLNWEAYIACDRVGVSIMEIHCRNETTKLIFVSLSFQMLNFEKGWNCILTRSMSDRIEPFLYLYVR